MIDYLEQLERDLVEAMERREQARGRQRARLRPGLPRLATAACALAALAALALLIALLPGRAEHRTVTHPPARHHQPPVHIPPRAPLRIVGTVRRVAPTAWQGEARGPGGVAGTLTITGAVDLTPRPCCDTPAHLPPGAVSTIHFQWKVRGGAVEGSIRVSVLRRPHSRFVWDGLAARGVRASGVLRRYGGRSVSIAGDTPLSAPARSRIILGQA
jgi:hypothetical protein